MSYLLSVTSKMPECHRGTSFIPGTPSGSTGLVEVPENLQSTTRLTEQMKDARKEMWPYNYKAVQLATKGRSFSSKFLARGGVLYCRYMAN